MVFIKIKTDHFIKLIDILILKIYRDTFTPKIQSPHGDNLTMQDMIFLNEEGSSRATVNHDNSFCENKPLISPYIMEFDVNKSVSFYRVIKYMHQKLL